MAATKKTKKKKTQPAKSSRKKSTPAKKLAKRKPVLRKNLAKKKKKTASKQASAKNKTARKKPVAAKRARTRKSQLDNMVAFPQRGSRARTGGQSGDLQGLSDVERSNSESVDELLEEGNAFEAEAVRGVEEAGNADEEEVHTHEVPEDDVPGEYLDND